MLSSVGMHSIVIGSFMHRPPLSSSVLFPLHDDAITFRLPRVTWWKYPPGNMLKALICCGDVGL